jgi:CelD/BcsL family acetyltransferase involved in cellulose biosynthesis
MSGSELIVAASLNAFEALAAEWNTLAKPFATPLLDHDWFACAARAFHREADLRITIVRNEGRLVAAAPVALSSGRLIVVGSEALNEPTGLVYESDEALQTLALALIKSGHAVVLNRLPGSSQIAQQLSQRARGRAIVIARTTAGSCAVSTVDAWPKYLDVLSARTRKMLATARARAEREVGPVNFERCAPVPDQVAGMLAQLVRLEAGGWKAKNGSALATRPQLMQFFQEYAIRSAARGRTRISVLKFGDVAVAAELGVEAYGKMWGLKLAYDERFARCAPALQLVHHSIEATHDAGLSAYEFLGSAEAWQERWRPAHRSYQTAAVYPFRPRAFVTAVREAAAICSRRIFKYPPRQSTDLLHRSAH